MNGETVGEEQGAAPLHDPGEIPGVDLAVHLVGSEEGDDGGPLRRPARGAHGEAGGLGGGPRSARLPQSHGDDDAGVAEVAGVGATLAAETDDGHLGPLQGRRVDVLFEEDLHFTRTGTAGDVSCGTGPLIPRGRRGRWPPARCARSP